MARSQSVIPNATGSRRASPPTLLLLQRKNTAPDVAKCPDDDHNVPLSRRQNDE